MGTWHYYIISGMLALSFLCGLGLLSSPKTAFMGNTLGAVSMLGAVAMVLIRDGTVGFTFIWVCVAVGGVAGLVLAVRATAAHMPRLVALFNGIGGLTSVLVAYYVLAVLRLNWFIGTAGSLALSIGCVSFSGSIVAAAKLHGLISPKPLKLAGHTTMTVCMLAMALYATVSVALGRQPVLSFIMLSAALSLAFGVLAAIRVDSGDIPVIMSVLNAFSGFAAAAVGLAIYDPLIIAVGGSVGGSGLMLSHLMGRSMYRSLYSILMGITPATETPRRRKTDFAAAAGGVPRRRASDIVTDPLKGILRSAKTVVIVPGYGMALSRSQNKLVELCEKLRANGAAVKVAIHPVAGRIPGHMNVLLSEAGLDYELFCEMDGVNGELRNTDLVIVVGANDIVNPAAGLVEGIPVFNVTDAKHVIVCNCDTDAGYSGVYNPLYDGREGVTLLLCDASRSVARLVECL